MLAHVLGSFNETDLFSRVDSDMERWKEGGGRGGREIIAAIMFVPHLSLSLVFLPLSFSLPCLLSHKLYPASGLLLFVHVPTTISLTPPKKRKNFSFFPQRDSHERLGRKGNNINCPKTHITNSSCAPPRDGPASSPPRSQTHNFSVPLSYGTFVRRKEGNAVSEHFRPAADPFKGRDRRQIGAKQRAAATRLGVCYLCTKQLGIGTPPAPPPGWHSQNATDPFSEVVLEWSCYTLVAGWVAEGGRRACQCHPRPRPTFAFPAYLFLLTWRPKTSPFLPLPPSPSLVRTCHCCRSMSGV